MFPQLSEVGEGLVSLADSNGAWKFPGGVCVGGADRGKAMSLILRWVFAPRFNILKIRVHFTVVS